MNTISKIAIIGAMECEIDAIKKSLFDLKQIDYAGLKIFTGTRNNISVILSQSGIGKVNAALNTQYIIDNFKPDVIINTGVAGGLAQGLKSGDIVIATYLVQHDFDVTGLGYPKGYMCTGIDKDKPTKYYCDKDLVNKFEELLAKYKNKENLHKGVVATGDQFISDAEVKKEINSLFEATAAEMEGGAIAQVAEKNKIPFVITRAISDLADGTDTEYHNLFEEFSKVSSEAIILFIDNL